MKGRALIVLLYYNNTLTEAGCEKHWERTASFKINNESIFKFLTKWSELYACLQHIKRCQKKKDGHGTYMALHEHYLGAQHVNQAARTVEAKLAALNYEGNTKRIDGKCISPTICGITTYHMD